MRLADAFSDSTPTMLGIGPMSAATVRAGLRAAAETGTPAVFIASRNQVESAELGGGYAEGWDQAGLVSFLREQAGHGPAQPGGSSAVTMAVHGSETTNTDHAYRGRWRATAPCAQFTTTSTRVSTACTSMSPRTLSLAMPFRSTWACSGSWSLCEGRKAIASLATFPASTTR